MNQRLKPFGLNLRHDKSCYSCNPQGLLQRNLARKLDIESPTLVRLLDLLAWIRRTTSSDKRRKCAILKPKANAQLEIIEKLSKKLRAEMMQGLSMSDIVSSTQVIGKMKNNLVPE